MPPFHLLPLLINVKLFYLKDVLLVDSGDPWNPKPEAVNKVNTMLQGVHRVLKPEGIFISISFGQVPMHAWILYVYIDGQ